MSEICQAPQDNVRADRYWLALADDICWRCFRKTRVLAVALPKAHETLEEDASEDPDDETDSWQAAEGNAFLFYIERMSDDVSKRLIRLSPLYWRARNESTVQSYWANHCEHCGTTLDDHDLHCEPDGAFVPTSEVAAALIELHEIAEPFIATAGGYTLEPAFFAHMLRRRR